MKSPRKKLTSNPRELRKPLRLKRRLMRIPTKSMREKLRKNWILLKKRRLFSNNNKN